MTLTRATRGFTLIEVLLAVVILAFGMIGVVRAYAILMSGIERAHFAADAACILKEKMGDIEKEAIEKRGIPPGTKSGSVYEDGAPFGWEMEATEVKIGSDKDKKGKIGTEKDKEGNIGPEESLTKVRLTVTGGGSSSPRRLSLYTYEASYSVSQ